MKYSNKYFYVILFYSLKINLYFCTQTIKNPQMKKLLILGILCFIALCGFTQKKAITEFGEEVILYENGSWEYLGADTLSNIEIPTSNERFEKSEKATFLLKSTRINLGFWINPKKWSFTKAGENEDAEYELQLREGDLYGLIISEKIEIPLLSLREIALENGRSAAPNLHIVQEEYRIVNGLKVLFLQMDGTVQGIKISYYGYYYSSPEGTVQFLTYTSQNLLDEFRSSCEDLLNGLVEL